MLEKIIFLSSVLNWSLKEATNRKVVKKWDNPYFIRIYLDHLKSIYITYVDGCLTITVPKLARKIKHYTVQ